MIPYFLYVHKPIQMWIY